MAKIGERGRVVKTKQDTPVNKLKKIVFIAAVSMLLLVAVIALVQTGLLFEIPDYGTLGPLPSNPFTADDFTYQDGYMTCLAGESWLGVDVSHHQGEIRWNEVADAGIRFAMIRIGHRAVNDGTIHLDRYWEENIVGARDAGLLVGVYFYSQAISVEEAKEEARFVLKALDGVELDFPVVFDWEIYSATGRNANVDPETVNASAVAFCEEISKAGYEPMVYFNLDLANRIWDLELLQQQGYPFWLALYRDQMNWEYRTDMWQYTESGSVPGIATPVDLNLYFIYD